MKGVRITIYYRTYDDSKKLGSKWSYEKQVTLGW